MLARGCAQGEQPFLDLLELVGIELQGVTGTLELSLRFGRLGQRLFKGREGTVEAAGRLVGVALDQALGIAQRPDRALAVLQFTQRLRDRLAQGGAGA